MRILCVIDSLDFGGAQKQLVELGIGFKTEGNDVSFLTYHDIPFYKFGLQQNGIPVICLRESSYIRRLLKIRNYIRKGKYDAVVAFLESPSFICEIAGLPFRKWKLIVGERSSNPEITKSIKFRLLRWFHLFADYVVSNSFENIKLVRKANPFLRKSKCKVIYNSLDLNHWNPDSNFNYRKSSKLHLVVASRFRYPKNPEGLLDALSLLPDEDKDKIHVDWYGQHVINTTVKEPGEEFLKKIYLLNLEKIITIHPSRQDIIEVIRNSDAVGLFSFFEGFPNSICEGMACGKPVICSSVSDIPLLLDYDPNLIFNPYDINSIKETLSYLIHLSNGELSEIGKHNAKIAAQNFEKKTNILMYLTLLKS